MTWHGPGQSVLYAICDLRPARRVRGFVDALVGAMADAAGLDGAEAGADATGLYIEGRKLGSVGIRVSGGITMHGLALNRDPDLRWFRAMTACGAPDVVTTSIVAEGGDPDRGRVEGALATRSRSGWASPSPQRRCPTSYGAWARNGRARTTRSLTEGADAGRPARRSSKDDHVVAA